MTTGPKLTEMVFMAPVDQRFAMAIGQVVVQWSVLEREFDELLEALLVTSSFSAPPEWKRLPLPKRFALFLHTATACFTHYPRIRKVLLEYRTDIMNAQIDRNLLSHGRISTVFPAKGGSIKLNVVGKYRGIEYDRTYGIDDLQRLIFQSSVTTGRIMTLREPEIKAISYPGWSDIELCAIREFQRGNIPPAPDRL